LRLFYYTRYNNTNGLLQKEWRMTPKKYERLKQNIDDLLPARLWLLKTALAMPDKKNIPHIIFKTPDTIYISSRAVIGDGTIIDGTVRIRGETVIGRNCIIETSHLTNARLGNYAFIGPFAQISESEIGEGTDIPHHAYIGNANIGQYCNIGDSVTISNFDGITKHQTIIEDGCFIGTKTRIVSPVRIGRESYVALQELSRDIPPHSFVTQSVDSRTGFHTETIKENRSFQLMPGKWLWTKKPIVPELMYALREKLNALIPHEKIWEFYENPHPAVEEQSPVNAIKWSGEEAVEKIIAWLDRIA
jgi:acyl-[acyl carrier protein]--UDP-N-acetylglucosamine O-acyltransferase